ncbi:MAG: NAD-dependent epimerase/dehydratase family protein [Elusimicrobiota bacterium]
MNVLIVGCGYLGKQVAKEFLFHHWNVFGSTTTESKLSELKKCGISSILLNLSHPQDCFELKQVHFDLLVICAAPSGSISDGYSQVYEQGIPHFVSYLYQLNKLPKKILYTSSIGVYEQNEGEWVNEQSALLKSNQRTQALCRAEEAIVSNATIGIVYRLGGIYGPGRNRIEAARKGELPKENQNQYLNLIHVTDAAKSIFYLLSKINKTEILNGVDNHSALRGEIFQWLGEKVNMPFESDVNHRSSSKNKRCSNEKLLQTGYSFQYPDFKAGYQSLFGDSFFSQ